MTEEAFSIHLTPWHGEPGQTALYRHIARMDQGLQEDAPEAIMAAVLQPAARA